MSLGLTPIPGDKPAGQKLVDDPDMDACKAEIDKLGNPDTLPEWKVIVNLAPKILGEKSKDLKVATWYAVGLLRLRGVAGLSEGIIVVRDLVATFWEALFPEKTRMGARSSALKWMLDMAQKWIGEAEVSESDREPISKMIDALEALGTMMRERIEGTPPSVTEFVSTMRGKLESLGAAAGSAPAGAAADEGGGAESGGAGAPEAGGAASAASGAGGGGAGGAARGPAGPIRSRDEAFKRLEEIIKFLKKAEPHSPISLLLQRALEWSKMSLEKVLTELIGGSDDVRKRMWEHLGIKEAAPSSGESTPTTTS